MINFFKRLFKKDESDIKVTITINGQTISTNDKEEIAELFKKFSENLNELNQENQG